MPLHLLGIARSGDIASLPRLEGTIAAPCSSAIQWVVHGQLAAAAVWPLSATFEPLEQAALLAAIHTHISILPMRYGTVLPDEEAVRHFLSNRCDNLLRDLVRVAGAGEVGLRIDLTEPVPRPYSPKEQDEHLPVSSPCQYLALRRQRYEFRDRLDRQVQLVTEDFVQAMHGLYGDWRTLTSTVPTVVRLAFLVQRKLWTVFRQRLETKILEQASRRCTLLGPWPPYSFV